MSGAASRTPPALMHNVEHNKVLHEQIIFVTVKTEQIPHVEESERLQVEQFGDGMYRAKVHYGFMEDPNIPQVLEQGAGKALPRIDPADTTYFLGRETIISTSRPGMAQWREKLFALDVAQCDDRDGVLRHSTRSRRRVGRTDRDLDCDCDLLRGPFQRAVEVPESARGCRAATAGRRLWITSSGPGAMFVDSTVPSARRA